MTTQRTDDGFSLLELLLTVAVLGIILGIAFPSYLHYSHSADKVAAAVETKQDETAAQWAEMSEPAPFAPGIAPTTAPVVAPTSAPVVVPTPTTAPTTAPTSSPIPTPSKTTPPPPMTLSVFPCETIRIIESCDPPKLYVGNYNKYSVTVGTVSGYFVSSYDSKCTAASYTITSVTVNHSIPAGDLSYMGILQTAHLVVNRPSVVINAGSKCKDATPDMVFTATLA